MTAARPAQHSRAVARRRNPTPLSEVGPPNPSGLPTHEVPVASKTAVIYLRVSTDKQVRTAHDPEGYSLPVQREACTRYAAQLGARVVAEFVEPGRSGTSTNRPALQEMLKALPELRPDYAIFYDLSRAARDDFDALWLLREIESHGTKLESTLERIDDSPAGKLLYTVMAGVNAFRSRGDAEKIKTGMERKHRSGGTNGPARLGYLNTREEVDGRSIPSISLDPVRAPLIRLAFDLMASGEHSLSTTLEVVTAAGLRTRASAKRPEKAISRSVLHRILTNPYYTGITVLRGVAVKGRHEAIVSRATFDRVQHTLESQRQGGLRTQYRPHYLAGTLYCGKCGQRLGFGRHTAKSGDKYAYFSCLSRSHPSGSCGAKYIPAHLAEQAIGAVHTRRWLTDEETQRVRQALENHLNEHATTARREAQRHQARQRELLAQEQKLVQLFYADAVSEETVKAERARIEQEKADIERWTNVATRAVDTTLTAYDKAAELLATPLAAYLTANEQERRLLNTSTFERIELSLGPDQELAAGDWDWHVEQLPGSADADLRATAKLTATAREIRRAAALTAPTPDQANPAPNQRTPARLSPDEGSHFDQMEERGGFEPPSGLPRHMISSHARSTTPAPLQGRRTG